MLNKFFQKRCPCPNCHDVGGGGYLNKFGTYSHSSQIYICDECEYVWENWYNDSKRFAEVLGNYLQHKFNLNLSAFSEQFVLLKTDFMFSVSDDILNTLISEAKFDELPFKEYLYGKYYYHETFRSIGSAGQSVLVLLIYSKSELGIVFPVFSNDIRKLISEI